MSLKRKFSSDDDEPVFQQSKQLRLDELAPSSDMQDVDMSDSFTDDSSPVRSVVGLPSDSADSSPVVYPSFNIYPVPPLDFTPTSFPSSSASSAPITPIDEPSQSTATNAIGLIQPKTTTTAMSHHGPHCTQIPKLRISCSAGLYGHRTMWSHCEQCGAIEMVDG